MSEELNFSLKQEGCEKCGATWFNGEHRWTGTGAKGNELDLAVKEMMLSKKPFFLEVCVEKEDNVFPMIPSGASVSDIRLE